MIPKEALINDFQVELGLLKNENNCLKKDKNDAESAHYDEKKGLEDELRSVKSKLEQATKDANVFFGRKEMYKKDAKKNEERVKNQDREIQVDIFNL